MKIAVIGTRGFPHVQGGVERHCENLYPALAKKGLEIFVFTRLPYIKHDIKHYEGVNLLHLPCPRNKYLEAITHSFLGVLAAKKLKADILHVHAVGPAIIAPIARTLGMLVVFTHHGPDYVRKKWGKFSKKVLKLGEMAGASNANAIIAITDEIANNLKLKRSCNNISVIPNGVSIQAKSNADFYLQQLGLEKERYILSVGRFVPEKGLHDLIEAFKMSHLGRYKLVIAGNADHEDSYSKGIRSYQSPEIVLPGFLSGEELRQLYSHACMFVLPSYYEGLPIALLEAMSYGLSCLATDIPGNRVVISDERRIFKAGDIQEISKRLRDFIDIRLSEEERAAQIAWITTKFSWSMIADKTYEIYERVIRER